MAISGAVSTARTGPTDDRARTTAANNRAGIANANPCDHATATGSATGK